MAAKVVGPVVAGERYLNHLCKDARTCRRHSSRANRRKLDDLEGARIERELVAESPQTLAPAPGFRLVWPSSTIAIEDKIEKLRVSFAAAAA